jgi:hypothetical protein
MSYIFNMLKCVGMILLDNLLQYFLFIAMIDLSRTCGIATNLICYALVMFMIYSWVKIKLKVLIYLSIQKPYYSHFSFMAGFVDALRPTSFTGANFKRWQMRVTLWLTEMNVFWVSEGKPEGELSPEKEKEFSEANTIFCGAVVRVLAETLQDTYLRYKITKEMWDTLNTEYGGSDAGIELYIIEQYHNYQMIDGKSVVTQAHEIQCLVKKLGLLKIVVPDEFVIGGIIAKLPPSWRDFATALKHKRVHMSILDFIASLDVEEKARAKDGRSKGAEGQTSVNMVHQQQTHGKGNGKAKQNQNNSKPKQTTTFKKKKKKKKKNKDDEGSFVCESPDHWAKKCPNRKGRKPQPKQKTSDMVVSSSGGGTSGYGNLPYVLLVFQSTTW